MAASSLYLRTHISLPVLTAQTVAETVSDSRSSCPITSLLCCRADLDLATRAAGIGLRSSSPLPQGLRKLNYCCQKPALSCRVVRAEVATEKAGAAKISAMEVPTTHKAWTYAEYGPPGVLKLEQIPVPDVAADEVLVKVHAAALNPVDGKRRQGKFKNTDSPLPVSLQLSLLCCLQTLSDAIVMSTFTLLQFPLTVFCMRRLCPVSLSTIVFSAMHFADVVR
jgi:hypothetical protein